MQLTFPKSNWRLTSLTFNAFASHLISTIFESLRLTAVLFKNIFGYAQFQNILFTTSEGKHYYLQYGEYINHQLCSSPSVEHWNLFGTTWLMPYTRLSRQSCIFTRIKSNTENKNKLHVNDWGRSYADRLWGPNSEGRLEVLTDSQLELK